MIIFSTASLYPYGLNRIFEISKKAGFDGVELMVRSKGDTSYLDTWDADYLKTLEEINGLKTYSLHVPFEFEEDQSSFDQIITLAEKLKIVNIIIHTPREDQIVYKEWMIKSIFQNSSFTLKHGILIENVHVKVGKADPIFKKIEDFKILPAMCLDIAHALRSNQDPELFIKSLDNVRQWHLSNWNGKDDHLSVLPEKEKFAKFFKIKPIECVCLELCPKAFHNIGDQEEIIGVLRETIDFVRGNAIFKK